MLAVMTGSPLRSEHQSRPPITLGRMGLGCFTGLLTFISASVAFYVLVATALGGASLFILSFDMLCVIMTVALACTTFLLFTRRQG